MKIYLATASHEPEKAKEFMKHVKAYGHTITCDWTKNLQQEKKMSKEELKRRAHKDIIGIQQADLLIVVMQKTMKEKMTGVAIEIGVAIGSNVPVAIAQEECKFDHFFANHPEIFCFNCLVSVLHLVRKLEGKS